MTIFVYILIFIILFSAAWTAISAAPWVPTRSRDVKRMIDLAKIKKGETVYDLGCGDGRLVFAADRVGANGRGVELFVLPYVFAKIKSLFYKNSKIIFGDLFRINLAEADVVFIFLLDKSYQKLIKKFEQELKPGARVVVGCWPIAEWADKLIVKDKPSDRDLPIYVYKK
ncbi:MAG: methyltransferase domain-containing protein [Patescibacteria group bacterium]